MLEIGWFSTGRGPTSRRLLAAVQEEIASGRLNARIAVVFCNREHGEEANSDLFLELVQDCGLPLVCLSSAEFRRKRGGRVVRKGDRLPDWRRQYDDEVMRLLAPFSFEIGMLAGYMLIFSEEFSRHYDLLNLHPGAPGGPKGVWQDVVWELIDRRAARGGAMIHLATPELDEGPAVTYCTYGIRGQGLDRLWEQIAARPVAEIRLAEGEANPLFSAIRRLGVEREVPLVIETLRALTDGRLKVAGGVFDEAGQPAGARDLTEAIERAVESANSAEAAL